MPWISIAPSELPISETRDGDVEGVEIMMGVSPFDIPQKVRSRIDPAKPRELRIDFKYLESGRGEPRSDYSEPGSSVTLEIGDHSGRLYCLRIDIDSLLPMSKKSIDPESLETLITVLPESIDRAIQHIPQTKRGKKRQKYNLASTAISHHARELLTVE